ncbi:TonB-dependent receptor domain-containing protein [Halomonas denitrificans]|nr:TonB-dependent receptor [Halomonas denitrificans]
MKQFCNLAAAGLAALVLLPVHAADTASRLDSPAATTTLQIIDREMIERSGKYSLAEVLRDLPLNSAGSPRPGPGFDSQAYAGANLRGLDTERTLVLVNGRREAIDPATATGSNLNFIPLAMVERIEILPSGAGAIHGMNAIGGVINIITRDDFRGVEASVGTSWTERAGGEVEGASVLAGIGDERGSIVVGASYDERDIVFARNRRWSRDDSSVFANNFLTSGFSFLDDGAANLAGCRGPGFTIDDDLCRYDAALLSAEEVSTRNESLFANARYRIDEDWSLSVDARVGRSMTFRPGAPVASVPWLVGGFGTIRLEPGTPNHPATPPSEGGLNPLWENYSGVRDDLLLNVHRFAANGPLRSDTEAVSYNVALDLQGRIGRFDVSLAAQRAEIQHDEIIDNFVLPQLAQPAIDSGAYNLYDPFGSPSDVLEAFETTGSRDANFLLRSLRGIVATDIFDLPGGSARLLLGVELRDETFEDRPDALRAAERVTGSRVVGGSGNRELWAAFGELALPITGRLDAIAAVRWDDYDFAVAGASGRLALHWHPLDRLHLHAGWSRSLSAEPLRQPDSSVPAFTSGFIDPRCIDPSGPPGCFGTFPGGRPAFPLYRVRNPALDPEVADQVDLGFRYAPVESIEVMLNAFDLRIKERTTLIGAQQIANCVEGISNNCPGGLRQLDPVDLPPDETGGLGVARDAEGRILYIQTGFASIGRIETRGIDVRLSGRWRFGEFGLNSTIDATWVDRYRVDGGTNLADDNGRPDWRGQWRTVLDWHDFALTWIVNHIADQDDALDGSGPLPSWTTHDVQLRWSAPWNADVAVGVDNLADRDPVLDRGEPGGFNFALYDGYGRLGYLRYTQRF